MILDKRILETLQYVSICSMLFLKYSGLSDLGSSLSHDAAMFFLIAGLFIQGFRYVQLPMYLTFLATQLVFGSSKMENLELITGGTSVSLVLYFIWGGHDFNRVQTSGPFDVGYRNFTTKEFSNDCSVFYPVDKDARALSDKTVYYLKYGDSLDSIIDI